MNYFKAAGRLTDLAWRTGAPHTPLELTPLLGYLHEFLDSDGANRPPLRRIVLVSGHPAVCGLDILSQGQRIVAAFGDRTARVWDVTWATRFQGDASREPASPPPA